MKLSARNQLKGKIVDVKKGATTAHIRIDIGGQIITASITNESVDEMQLATGKSAYAIIKATSVMVGSRLIMRNVLTAAAFFALTGACFADDGCDKFAWPLTREQALLAAPDKSSVKAGDTLPAAPKGAVVLNLQPDSAATFAMPPERKAKAQRWFGGIVRMPAVDKPGVYQVTLSDEAWLDVVQDGRYAHTVGFSGRHDCPGVRKSVRFELGAAPFVLQISGAAADKIGIAIGPRD